jgi:starch phosphorylase
MQVQVDRQFRDKDTWAKKAILNTANAGWFSSDRTIAEYNEKIWNLKAIEE